MHRATASYVSHVSFRQLGNKVDTIEHQLREPVVTVTTFQKFMTYFVSMQGKFRVIEESMKQIQMTANGHPPPNPSLVAFEGNISDLSLRLDGLASEISSLDHSLSAFDFRLPWFSSRFDGVESLMAPLYQAVEAIRRQSREFQSRLKKVERGVLATSSPKTDSQVKAMLGGLRTAPAKCQHDFSISFEECHTRLELSPAGKQTRVEALIVGLKTQFVTSIRDMHANLTREYNQSVLKVREQLNSRCEALTKGKENLERKIASLEAYIPGLLEERVSAQLWTFNASLEAMQKKIENVEGTMSQEVARAVDAMPSPAAPPDRSASHLFVMRQVEKVESRVDTIESLEPLTTALRRIDAIE